ncbi:hypothetical protein JTB14_001921 [Gonioctena quinquepunctata]|nr:hypothetical protein JTB14_001921 [Gonioctena quinquepunctata]
MKNWIHFGSVVLVTINLVCPGRSSDSTITIGVSKCCGEDDTNCDTSSPEIDYRHNYTHNHETNQVYVTFIRTQVLSCAKDELSTSFYYDEFEGFRKESSVSFDGKLYNDTSYCVFADNNTGRIGIKVCIPEENFNNQPMPTPAKVLPIYLPLLIISTLCYFFSAFVYTFILKVKEVHKKCFIAYSFSMGITFSFLIVLQTSNDNKGCYVIGSIFFFFILKSFVWLACLCTDLVVTLRKFKTNCNENRCYWYLAAALGIPSLVFATSLIPAGIPDVPHTFIKPNGGGPMCKFEGKPLFFFITVGPLMLLSLGILVYNIYLIRQYNKLYRCHIRWLETKSQFNYKTQSCCLTWLTTAIWIIDVSLRNSKVPYGNPEVYDIIEALQGVFAVAIFVSNRYTRKEFREKFSKSRERNHDRPKRWTTFRKVFRVISHAQKRQVKRDPEQENMSSENENAGADPELANMTSGKNQTEETRMREEHSKLKMLLDSTS